MFPIFRDKYKCEQTKKIIELQIQNNKLNNDIRSLRNILADLCLINKMIINAMNNDNNSESDICNKNETNKKIDSCMDLYIDKIYYQ